MGPLKIVIAILIWSSLGIFIRNIDLPNQSIIFYTAAIAGLFQFGLLTTTGRLKKEEFRNAGINNKILLFLSPLCFVANTMLFYFAMRNTTIANAVLTHYTAPVFVAMLAPVLLKEKIEKTTWLAIVLSSAGLWFIMSSGNSGAGILLGGHRNLGIIAGAMSGLAYAFLIIIVRKIADAFSSLFIIFVQNMIVVAVLMPFIINIPVPTETIPNLILLGLFHSTIAPILYVQGFRTVKASEAAVLGYFEPVGAILLAFLFLKEAPQIQALLGGALILYSGRMIIKKR